MNAQIAIIRLKAMLEWSDRIGSDEVYEIKNIVQLLEKGIDELQAT